jgi:PD-(D/E)XK nuclease superfamily
MEGCEGVVGIVITNSMMKSYNRCHRQWDYKFNRELVPQFSSLPLKRGTWLHELLEAHYTGYGWRKRLTELTAEFNKLFDEEKEMYGDLPTICRKIMESYEYHYKKEDAEFDVIAAEQLVQVALPHGHTLEFKFDAVIEDEYGRWLMEHKSHRRIPTADYRFIDMQTAKYVWGLNQIGTYGEITGVLWNYIRTKEPTKPKLTKKTGQLSRRRIDTDVLTYYKALVEYGLDPHDFRDVLSRLKKHQTFFRRERVPKPTKVIETLVKETVVVADAIEKGVKPIRSIERGCEFSCSYKDICIVELYGGDADDVLKRRYRPATTDDYYGYHLEEKISES